MVEAIPRDYDKEKYDKTKRWRKEWELGDSCFMAWKDESNEEAAVNKDWELMKVKNFVKDDKDKANLKNHMCKLNFSGPSTKMEQEIVTEGLKYLYEE